MPDDSDGDVEEDLGSGEQLAPEQAQRKRLAQEQSWSRAGCR